MHQSLFSHVSFVMTVPLCVLSLSLVQYCDSCLKRLYGHPADQPLQSVAAGFQCPACLGNCVCAGCERKTSGNGSAAATAASTDTSGASSNNGGGGSSSADDSSNISEGSPTSQPQQTLKSEQQGAHSSHGHRGHSNSLSSGSSASLGSIVLPASSGASPSKPAHMQQTKPTTPQGKPPVKKRRTSVDVGNANSAMGVEESETKGNAFSGAASAAAAAASASSGSTHAPPHPSLHIRSSSGEISIPSLFHAPQSAVAFNTGTTGGMNTSTAALLYSPCHSRGNSGGGASNRIPSPRLAALTAVGNASAGSRMIHLPPFALSPSTSGLLSGVASAVSGHGSMSVSPSLGPLSFSYGASPFAPHIQQHVQAAVQQAAQQQHQQQQQHHTAMKSESSDSHSHTSSSILNSTAPSLSNQSIGGLLTVVSAPCSPYASSRHIPARRMSAFSPVQNAPLESGEEGQHSAAALSTSMAGLTGPSPTVSPSLFHRSLQLNSPSLPPKPSAVSSTVAAAAAAAALSVSPTSENELMMMKVLANVACSATTTTASSTMPATAVGAATGAMASNNNSASLPPTHPVMNNREAASPKLSGFMASVSLMSPSHSAGMMLPPSASAASGLLGAQVSASSQSLAANVNLSVMQAQLKAQHQMEVQCLLLQQQQQLAELERFAAREASDGQQMMQLQQQTTYWQQQQQQQTQMRGLNASSSANSSAVSQATSPSSVKQDSLRSDPSAAVKVESEMKTDPAAEEKKSLVSPSAAALSQSSSADMQAS